MKQQQKTKRNKKLLCNKFHKRFANCVSAVLLDDVMPQQSCWML